MHTPSIIDKIFDPEDGSTFEELALKIFLLQAKKNPVYKKYLAVRGIAPEKVIALNGIPFLPIDFFKSHKITCGTGKPQQVFTSSGTTGTNRSAHHVLDVSLYEKSFRTGFELFYGDIKEYCVLALLPSYSENKNSSLIYMVRDLISLSNHPVSGFFNSGSTNLYKELIALENIGQKTILIGVSFALMDFAEKYSMNLSHTTIIETGGMKGRRAEITREEMHKFLSSRLGTGAIHSEYGMTELLSQAWSTGDGIFYSPPWMKIMIRDLYDPFSYIDAGRNGGINVIDLANINSCSFIETKDIGTLAPSGGFLVQGRMDNSEMRGCNLLYDVQ